MWLQTYDLRAHAGGDIATSGILNDIDGTLGSGAPGGVVAPYAGQIGRAHV